METTEIVAFHDKELITTSSIVAKIFGKQHGHVLREIEKIIQKCELLENHHSRFGVMVDHLLTSEEMVELNHTGVEEEVERRREFGRRAGQLIADPLYPPTKDELALEERKKEVAARIAAVEKNTIDSSKRQYFRKVEVPVPTGKGGVRMSHEYEMNRDGFFLLAMGFTGPKALEFKVQFIQEFNRLEHIAYAQLRKNSEELLAIHDGDAMQHYSNELERYREQISTLKMDNRDLWERLQGVEDKLSIVTKNGRYAKAHRAISKEAIGVTSGKFYRHGKVALRAAERMKKMKDVDALKYQGLYIEDLLNQAMDANVDISLSWGIDHEAMHDEDEIARLESNLIKDFDLNFQKHNF